MITTKTELFQEIEKLIKDLKFQKVKKLESTLSVLTIHEEVIFHKFGLKQWLIILILKTCSVIQAEQKQQHFFQWLQKL